MNRDARVLVAAFLLAGCGDSAASTTGSGGATSVTSATGSKATGATMTTATTTTSSSSSGEGACSPAAGCPAAATDCVGLVDNAGAPTYALRVSQLTFHKPAVFTDLVLKGLFDSEVSLNLPACKTASNDPVFPPNALGSFSWIFAFDGGANQLTIGGAKPEADPSSGYCFVNELIEGFDVHPVVVSAPVAADGTFASAAPADVVLPAYGDSSASSVILLPIRQLKVHDAQLSSDHDCIGQRNPNLDPADDCFATDAEPSFIDAAAIDGFITLDDADGVAIDQLGGKSLCVLLTADVACSQYCDASGKKCLRDGNNAVVFEGDWCSTTNAPATAGCHDAMALNATFAASSAPVKSACP